VADIDQRVMVLIECLFNRGFKRVYLAIGREQQPFIRP
jgi:hypothetical protein